MTQDLTTQPVTLTIAGETLHIAPVKFGKVSALIKAAKPLLENIQNADFMPALLEHPDAVLDVIAILSGKPRDWVESLDLDDVVTLGGACVEVNAGFFVQSVMPKLQSTAQRVTGAIASALPNA